jgi:hypothetical protein
MGSGSVAGSRSAENGEKDPTPRELAYRRVLRVRRSTDQFVGTLRRTTAEVSDQAVTDRELEQARRVMALMIANVSLAQEMLDGLSLPGEWMRPVE